MRKLIPALLLAATVTSYGYKVPVTQLEFNAPDYPKTLSFYSSDTVNMHCVSTPPMMTCTPYIPPSGVTPGSIYANFSFSKADGSYCEYETYFAFTKNATFCGYQLSSIELRYKNMKCDSYAQPETPDMYRVNIP